MQTPEPKEEERPVADDPAFDMPTWFRWVVGGVAILLIGLPTLFLIRYSLAPEHFVSPSELGVSQLILAGVGILLIALAPWKAMGLRLRKVGMFEFDRVISGQAAEHAEEMTELRTRLDELESRARGLDDLAPISEHLEDVELAPLLAKFLDEHRSLAISPLRIREWGSRQPGYEKLAQAQVSSIRRILQKFVAEGRAVTRVSERGNTLYKVS